MTEDFDISDIEIDIDDGPKKGMFDAVSRDEAFGDVNVQAAELCEALRDDAFVCIDFFIHEQAAKFGIPNFHAKILNLMIAIDKPRIAIAVPRGHAKTTIAKISAVWHWLHTETQFVMYLGNTEDSAVKACTDIMDFVKSENFRNIFGAPKFEMEREGTGEYHFYIKVPKFEFVGGKPKLEFVEKFCILKARGSNQQIRGLNIHHLRPQLCIADDIEDVDNTATPEAQNKLDDWFYRTVMKALSNVWNKIIFIGNMVSNECLLGKLCDDPDWVSVLMGCILPDGRPLWPELFPLDKLLAELASFKRLKKDHLWYAEMMNLRTAGSNAIIEANEIYYTDSALPENILYGFITIDPAQGKGRDSTAIAVHLLIPQDEFNFLPTTVDYIFGQFDENATYDEAIKLAFKWGVKVIGIESVLFQRALAVIFELRNAMNGYEGFEIVKTYPGNASKSSRITAWASLLKAKVWALIFGEMHITSQLLKYNPKVEHNDDDLIDACSQAPKMLEDYMPIIFAKKIGKMLNLAPIREVEMCV